jgi:hypothetical protein
VAGHTWPGGPPRPAALRHVLGPQSETVDANATLAAFFRDHPLRQPGRQGGARRVRDGPESDVAGLVLFDLDNTLADREAAFRRWAEHFVVEHDLEASCVEFLCAGDSHGLLPRDELFASLRGRYGVTASVEELVLRYRADYPRYFEPDPDVRAALTALRADGWKIGIVTNGPTSQNAKVASLRLGDLVDRKSVV